MRVKLKKAIDQSPYNAAKIAVITNMHKSTLYNHIKNRANLGYKKAQSISDLLNISLQDVYEV